MTFSEYQYNAKEKCKWLLLNALIAERMYQTRRKYVSTAGSFLAESQGQGCWFSQGARLSAIAADSLSLYGSTGEKPFTERFSLRPFES